MKLSVLVIEGKVKAGRKEGRRLGFPTINIPVPSSVKKSSWGVYLSLIKIGDKIYPGLTNLGPAKTFLISRPNCESYLLTLRDDLYGRNSVAA